MKRIVALLISLAMLLTCGMALADTSNIYLDETWPVVKDKISVKIAVVPQNAGEYDTSTMWITRYWDEMSNLDIEWQIIDSAAASEKVPLMLQSGDMPDAMMGFYGFDTAMINRYGVDEGILYPVNELMQYMPKFSKVFAEDSAMRQGIVTPDGNIYGFPLMADGGYTYPVYFFVNNEWLTAAGLESPKTLDDFYKTLVYFRDNDMDGDGNTDNEIPWCASWNEGSSERAWILNAYGFCTAGKNTALKYNADGSSEATYIPYTAEYKEYLAFMNKLYTEGLLDPDTFTQTQQQCDAKFTEGIVGFVMNASPAGVDATKEFIYDAAQVMTKDADMAPIYPQQIAVQVPGVFVINADCEEEKAAAIANWVDSFFDPITYLIYRMGPSYDEVEHEKDPLYGGIWNTEMGHYYIPEKNTIGYHYDENQYTSAWLWRSTQMTFWTVPGYSTNGNQEWNFIFDEKYPDTGMGQQYLANNKQANAAHWAKQAIADWCCYYHNMLPNFFYSVEDQTDVDDMVILLDDFVSGKEAKFITGELSLEKDYDQFVSTLEGYGVQNYINLLNKYWEAANK